MIPSASGEDWTMHPGSCLDEWTGMPSLADLSIDVTITDPPYEYEAHQKGKRQGVNSGRDPLGSCGNGRSYARVVDQGFAFDALDEVTRSMAGASIARVTKKAALIFCQVEAVHLWRLAIECHGLVYRRTIPWVKPDAMPSLHGKWPGQSFECIVLAMRPGVQAPIGGKARYYSHVRERGDARAHPTAKPIRLMREIVEDFTAPGDLVMDSFAGSGTTGVACRALGRRFVGWEMLDGTIPVKVKGEDGAEKIEYPDYFAAACRRLSGEAPRTNPTQEVLSW